MTVMEYMNSHREDMEPCECVILPDGSVEEPQPSHIKKLEEISGEDKLTLNSRMEKNMEPLGITDAADRIVEQIYKIAK